MLFSFIRKWGRFRFNTPGSSQICIAKCIYSYGDVVSLAAAFVLRGALRDETKTAAMETNRDDQAENLVKLTA